MRRSEWRRAILHTCKQAEVTTVGLKKRRADVVTVLAVQALLLIKLLFTLCLVLSSSNAGLGLWCVSVCVCLAHTLRAMKGGWHCINEYIIDSLCAHGIGSVSQG